MKIMHIVGNRPQFVKLAILQAELSRHHSMGLILHTGQHFDPDMSDIFFSQLDIPRPDYSLNINQLPHNEMIGQMLVGIDAILRKDKPDLVLVYGDTNTTLAGALAAKKRGIPLAHVEAGVRTGDESMPEESNRYLTDRMADFNFCCTSLGMENLRREGFSAGFIRSGIYFSGDLMLDALGAYLERARTRSPLPGKISTGKPFILATLHREENISAPDHLKNIADALNRMHRETPVLMPLHPGTRQMLASHQIRLDVETCNPLGYLDMLSVLDRCQSVITDSGGLSREAFFLQKPTLILMKYPFWPETIEYGNCLAAQPRTEEIVYAHQEMMGRNKPFQVDVFGDGKAAAYIRRILLPEN